MKYPMKRSRSCSGLGHAALIAVVAGLICAGSHEATASTAALGSSKAQQIKGWGVYPSGYVGQYPVKLVDVPNAASLLFAIKFNYVRIGVASDTGKSDGTLDSTRMSDMRTQISKAIAYTGNYYLVTWSPPAYMKLPEQTTLGHSSSGATEYLNSSYESAYVSYWIKVLQDIKNNNMTLPAYISLQNESNFDAPSWEGCDYDINDTQRALYRTLVKDMRTALNNNSFSNVGVLAPETENYNGALSILGSSLGQLGSDTTLKNAIAGLCVHSYDQYGCASVKSGASTYGKDLWQTEWSNAVWPESDGDETKQAVTMLRHIGGDLVDGGINYWFWWGGINNTSQSNPDNENLLWGNTGDSNWHLSKKYYVLKTLINNVQPGWSLKPFSSSDDADLKVSNSTDPNPHYVELYAFEDSGSTKNVVVVANGSSSAKTVTINGLKGTSAAVYTLDSSHNMDNTANPTISSGSTSVSVPATGAIILATSGTGSGGTTSNLANGTYTLTPGCATGSRLDANGTSTANGTKVQIYQSSGASNQNWVFTKQSNGWYKVQPAYATGLCLDVNGQGTTNGTKVQLWSDNGSTAQQWNPIANSNGSYKLNPACATGMMLDVTGSSATNGTQVEIYSDNGSTAQQWTLSNSGSGGSTTGGGGTTDSNPTLTGTNFNDGAGAWGGGSSTADKAFDANTSTYYDCANGSGGYTGIDVGSGKTATVTSIRYYARSGFASRMTNGVFEGSNTQTSGYTTLATVSTASDTAWTTVTVSGASAYRYLRYRGPDGGYCNVAEIEFHGTTSTSSSGSTGTQLSSSGWSMQGANTDVADGPNAWDNNTSTRWTTWADQTNGQYFAVNLGSQQSFSKIVLDAGNGDYPRGYQVYVSNDGSNWGSAVATGNGSSQTTTITFSQQSAKYVKIVQTGSVTGAWWSIAEMKIYN